MTATAIALPFGADENDLKARFAVALVQFVEPFKAAMAVFPDNVPLALQVSKTWPHDPAVVEHKAFELDNGGEERHAPTSIALARMALDVANSALEDADKLKAIELAGKLLGHLGTGGANVNVTNNTLVDNRRVMAYKDHGSDDEWEEAARKQQAALIDVST